VSIRTTVFSVLTLFLSAIPGQVIAQLETSISATRQHDDNVFGTYQKLSDDVTQFYLNISKDYDGDYNTWTLSYDGNLNLFSTYSFRNYHAHALGLDYQLQLNREEEKEEGEDSTEAEMGGSVAHSSDSSATPSRDSLNNYFYPGASLSGRFDRDSVDYYDNGYAFGYAKLRWVLSDSLVGHVMYHIGYRNYLNLKELSNLENGVLVNLLSNLGATKLSAVAGYGYKKYFSTTTDTTELEKLGVTSGGVGPGKGKAKGRGVGSGTGVQRGVVITQLSTPGSSLIGFGAGLVQRIGIQTEVGLRYFRQTSPSLNGRYINGQLRGYGPNDEIYDDSYTYRSHLIAGSLKQSFPWAMTLKVDALYMPKTYGRPAFSLPDSLGQSVELSSTRKDERFELSFQLEHAFKFKNGFARTFTIQFGYSFVNNRSNDDFYRFTDNLVSVGIEADF
jgi:hypothetical protein